MPPPLKWKKFSLKLCPTGDCYLAQDASPIREETNCLDPLIFKTVSKMSYPITVYYIQSY